MKTRRESLMTGMAGFAAITLAGGAARAQERNEGDIPGLTADYGLIGQIKAVPGKREELMTLLARAIEAMPGNIAYLIGADIADPNGIWVTEYWRDKAAHDEALKLPNVQAAIARGRPLIAEMGMRVELKPA